MDPRTSRTHSRICVSDKDVCGGLVGLHRDIAPTTKHADIEWTLKYVAEFSGWRVRGADSAARSDTAKRRRLDRRGTAGPRDTQSFGSMSGCFAKRLT